MKTVAALMLALGMVGSALGALGADIPVALRSYLSFLIVDQTAKQAEAMLGGLDAAAQKDARAELRAWAQARKASLRETLGSTPEARAAFESFVSRLVEAEASQDGAFLGELAQALDVAGVVDYAALRQQVIQRDLGGVIESASSFLGVLQAWSEQQRAGISTGPLAGWLQRAAQPAPVTAPPPRAARSALADAEAGLGDYVGPDTDEATSPLDDYGKKREEARAREVEEARAGMQQVAEERRAAEEEYAQKKLAEAQADAEAVKRQADRMAAVDKEAQEQREKSWGNRLKKIVGATVSAATGAFTGGIGSRAGEEAADAIFGD